MQPESTAVLSGEQPPTSARPSFESSKHLALLEDSEHHRLMLRERLEAEQFKVTTSTTREECVGLLAIGYRTFLLDVNMGDGRKVEGLETLEEIKAECPDAFCAVVTGDPRYRSQARSLRADYYCGKGEDEIEHLLERLNDIYLRRRLDINEQITVRKVGQQLRGPGPSPEDSSADRVLEAASSFSAARQYIDGRIDAGDFPGASLELVLLEPMLRNLAGLSRQFGDGFGIAVYALWNAVLHHPGKDLNADQWRVWQSGLEKVLQRKRLSMDEACQFTQDLEDAGFDTEPPHWRGLAELLDTETHDSGLS